MKVSIYSDTGELLWWRVADHAAGFTAERYLHDGTQQGIVDALIEALGEARGQLSGAALFQVIDAVADARTAPAQVNGRVPLTIVRDHNAGR
jgi:hypothetical protein